MAGASDPYHEGELAAQRAAGEEDAARASGGIIGDAVISGAVSFLRSQRMLVVAIRDAQRRPWVSLLFGDAGFVSTEDEGRLVTIDRATARASAGDPLWANVAVGASLGLLAIELSTRRRLRINGRIDLLSGDRLVLSVEQAYPNCPKYIQRRRLRRVSPRSASARLPTREGTAPDAAILAAVRAADTIFVASGHPSRGLDASHRGGHSGFVKVIAPDVLRIPDYAGNGMFNTLGNLLIDPHCGLTLFEFQAGRVHQMTGDATVQFGSSAPVAADDPSRTGRSWDFRIRHWRSSDLPVDAEWEFVDYSPYNP